MRFFRIFRPYILFFSKGLWKINFTQFDTYVTHMSKIWPEFRVWRPLIMVSGSESYP